MLHTDVNNVVRYADFAEDVLSKNPVIVVGSGTSCGAGISGMYALGRYLVENVTISDFNSLEMQHWEVFKEKVNKDMGLEEALQSLGEVSELFTNTIVQATWNCILSDEREPLIRTFNGEDVTGFTRLFHRFRNTNIDCINIITTNYDHLIEMAAATADWEVWDGFGNGILARPVNSTILKNRMRKLVRPSRPLLYENIKHVKVYKPHGSLSWFKLSDNSFVKIPGVSCEHLDTMKPLAIHPVIVTPGIGKYLETHYEPYNNVMAEMNNSIHGAKAMIFLGFGFNDIHIQASFQSVLRDSTIPKLIATRELTGTFLDLVRKGDIKNYMAIEKYENGSKVISDQQPQEFIHENMDSWTLSGLLDITWGKEN